MDYVKEKFLSLKQHIEWLTVKLGYVIELDYEGHWGVFKMIDKNHTGGIITASYGITTEMLTNTKLPLSDIAESIKRHLIESIDYEVKKLNSE